LLIILGALVLTLQVHNDLPIARPAETVEIAAADLKPLGDLARVHVFDGQRELVAQTLDIDGTRSLIFQTDIGPNATRAFELRAGEPRKARREDFRVYGRFVRERFDDFAWENDRVAHRMYGAALETWQKEPLTSSAVDVWVKRTPRLVVNDWYLVDDYHRDHGEGADFYSAGPSRGCGGSGIWSGSQLFVSRNFRESRVLANGPLRLVFELTYLAWEAGGRQVAEKKRVTLDAGAHLNRFESTYTAGAGGPLTWAAGIKKPAGAQLRVEREQGWMRMWEPIRDGNGNLGCAVLVDPSLVEDATEAGGNALLVARSPAQGPAVYHAGSAWDRGPDVKTLADWDGYVAQWAQRLRSPIRVDVAPR